MARAQFDEFDLPDLYGPISPPGPGNLQPSGGIITPPGPKNLPPTFMNSHGPGSGAPDTAPRFVTPPGPPNLPPSPVRRVTPPGPPNLPRGVDSSPPGRGNLPQTTSAPVRASLAQRDNGLPDDGGYPPPPPVAPRPITDGEPDPNSNTPPSARAVWGPPRYQGGGVDHTKWMDPNHRSVKYDTLRYLDQFDPRQLGRPGLLALDAGHRAYLERQGWKIVDEDQIYRADVGTIDVLHGDRSEWGWNPAKTSTPKTPPKTPPTAPSNLFGDPKTWKPGQRVAFSHDPGKITLPAGWKQVGQWQYEYVGTRPTTPPATTPPKSAAVDLLNAGFTDPSTQTFQALIMRRLQDLLESVQRGDNDRYRNTALERVEELMRPVYSGAEEDALITRMREPLTQARDARQSQMKEIMGARNMLPTSGVYLDQVYNTPERDYERNLAQGTNELAVRAIDERQRRRTAALDTLAQLVGLGADERREDEGRERELITTGAILPEMTERRLRLLMEANGVPQSQMGSLTNSLMQLWNNQQSQANFQAGQSQMNAQQWGQLIAMLLNSPLLNKGAA